MPKTEKERLCKLLQIAYLNAIKVRPYIDFIDWIEWGELNRTNFHVHYKNYIQFTEFVKYISDTLFNEGIKSKLE